MTIGVVTVIDHPIARFIHVIGLLKPILEAKIQTVTACENYISKSDYYVNPVKDAASNIVYENYNDTDLKTARDLVVTDAAVETKAIVKVMRNFFDDNNWSTAEKGLADDYCGAILANSQLTADKTNAANNTTLQDIQLVWKHLANDSDAAYKGTGTTVLSHVDNWKLYLPNQWNILIQMVSDFIVTLGDIKQIWTRLQTEMDTLTDSDHTYKIVSDILTAIGTVITKCQAMGPLLAKALEQTQTHVHITDAQIAAISTGYSEIATAMGTLNSTDIDLFIKADKGLVSKYTNKNAKAAAPAAPAAPAPAPSGSAPAPPGGAPPAPAS